MAEKEKYVPSPEEIKKAEDIMTPEQVEQSKKRKEGVVKEIYKYRDAETEKYGSYDAGVDIRIGEKFESAGLLDQAISFYELAEIDASNVVSIGMGAWLVANSLDGSIPQERRSREYNRRQKEYEQIKKIMDDKIARLKKYGGKSWRDKNESW